VATSHFPQSGVATLWIVLDKVQVNISTSSSKDNFYKHIKGMKLLFKEERWKIKFE
jgi:hypothetical protein